MLLLRNEVAGVVGESVALGSTEGIADKGSRPFGTSCFHDASWLRVKG